MFECKKMSVVKRVIERKSATRFLHLASLRKQLFRPVRKSERDTTARMIELVGIAESAIVSEL